MTGEIPLIPGVIGMTTAQQPKSTPETAAVFDAATGTQRKAAEIGVGAAGADPAYIQMMEEFAAMPHAEIYRRAQEMRPGVMMQTAETWKAISTALTGNVIGITAKVNATIARGWEGQTAQAISAATTALTGRLTELQNVTQAVAWRVEAAGFGAEVVKAQIQPPPAAVAGPTVLGAENPVDAVGSTQAQSEAWQAAIWTMRNNYQPTYEPAGQGVPVFPTSNGLGGTEIPADTGGGSPASNGTREGTEPGTTPPSDPDQPTDDTTSSTAAGQNSSSSDDDSSDDNSDTTDNATTDDPTTDDSTGNDDTTAASTQQPSSGSPTTTGAPGGAPTGNPTGSPSAGTPAPGGQGTGTPNPGGPVVPGNPARNSTPLANTTPNTRGTTPMHGMPGMGAPAAARQNQKGDDEHQGRPELRFHPRNRIDLVGPPQGTVPPVLGARSPERRRSAESESP
ncbi:hypothetical protein [Nocardia sp. AG03]|uniref:hypothetical protein n=1 Tax=Nocardia sp. AG03 TaxID=3025312 RepID=UPI00241898EC|nr:hypothetical protein [Nocardia sp. AG03]